MFWFLIYIFEAEYTYNFLAAEDKIFFPGGKSNLTKYQIWTYARET